MAIAIKRDLYSEVTSRILAELERGAAPWVKPWRNARAERTAERGDKSALLWLQRHPALANARTRLGNAKVCDVQASPRGGR